MATGSLTPSSAILIALSGIVIVFIMLSALIGMIKLISVATANIGQKPTTSVPPAPAKVSDVHTPVPQVQYSVQDKVLLVDVDEKTAACIMGIVSAESGIPLQELRFKQIKAL